jgi:hypothetical protein
VYYKCLWSTECSIVSLCAIPHIMKRITNITGYLTALSIAIYSVLKFGYLEGAGLFMIITGIFLCIYFAVFILDKLRDTAEGKTLPVHIVGAFCASVINLAILGRFQHWSFSGILFIIGLGSFSLIFIPLLFLQKSRQPGADNLMNGAGAVGLAAFSLGMLCKLQHRSGAITLFIACPVLVFLIYFPMYLKSTSIPAEKKSSYLRTTFFVIIIAYLLFLFTYGTVMHWKVTKYYATTETLIP